MERRLFFTSPLDPVTFTDRKVGWPAVAKRLRQAVASSCEDDVTLDLVDEPLFAPRPAQPLFESAPAWAPDDDTHERLLALSEETLGARTIRIVPWSTYPGHGAIGFALGRGIRRKERRELLRQVPKRTQRQCTLLYEREAEDENDRYDVDVARVDAYRLDLDDDRGRSTLEDILAPLDEPFYLCERWLLQDDGGRVDEERFTIYREFGPDVVQCTPNLDLDPEAQDAARIHLWSMATRGAGLLALFPDDDNLEALARTFLTPGNHLQTMLAPPSGLLRVAIARTHPQMVVCCDSFWESFSGDQPVFIV